MELRDFLDSYITPLFYVLGFITLIAVLRIVFPTVFEGYVSTNLWFSILSPPVINISAPLALVLIGYLVERRYVGRLALFSNAIAINLHFYLIHTTNHFLITYGDIALIFGSIGIIWYIYWRVTLEEYCYEGDGQVHLDTGDNYRPLPQWFYKIGFLFSSVVVGLLILFT